MGLRKIFSRKGNTSQGSIINPQAKGKIDVADSDIQKQLCIISLTEEDLSFAPEIQRLIADRLDEVANGFYDEILTVEHLRTIIESNSTVDRLKTTLKRHIYEMFAGVIDEAYLAKRTRIAQVHYRIGLEPKWYMAAFQRLLESLLDSIQIYVSDRALASRLNRLTSKLLNFEQQLVLEAYERENLRQRELQYNEVKEELKQQVANLSEELAALSEQTSASVQQLLATSHGVNDTVQQSVIQSKNTQKSAQDSKNRMDSIDEQMTFIHTRTQDLGHVVNEMANSAREIQNVTVFVQEIAEQTNLLSLNSAIEAARAGEHGRGFAVVAQEVKNLSHKTQESVKQIEELISRSNQLTKEVIQSIQEIQGKVTTCKDEVNTSNRSLTGMVESIRLNIEEVIHAEQAIDGLTKGLDEISNATEKVAQSAEMLYDSIRNV